MPGCSVRCCKNWNGNTKHMNIKFFPFPKDPELRKKWIKACHSDDINFRHARVCSVHFKPECFLDKSHLQLPGHPPILKLCKNAVPTDNIDYPHAIIRIITSKEIFKVPQNNTAKIKTEVKTTNEPNSGDVIPVIKRIQKENKKPRPPPTVNTTTQLTTVPKSLVMQYSLEHNYCSSKQDSREDLRQNSAQEFYEDSMFENLCRRTKNLETEVEKLKAENKIFNEKLNNQEKYFEIKVKEKVNKILSSIFSSGKVKKFASNQICIKLSKSDISNAIVQADYKS